MIKRPHQPSTDIRTVSLVRSGKVYPDSLMWCACAGGLQGAVSLLPTLQRAARPSPRRAGVSASCSQHPRIYVFLESTHDVPGCVYW